MLPNLMDSKVLNDRLSQLGWTEYKLALELDKVRGGQKGAGNYTSTVKKVLQNPENSKAKTLEDLIAAMGGEIFVRWANTSEVVVSYEEAKLSDRSSS